MFSYIRNYLAKRRMEAAVKANEEAKKPEAKIAIAFEQRRQSQEKDKQDQKALATALAAYQALSAKEKLKIQLQKIDQLIEQVNKILLEKFFIQKQLDFVYSYANTHHNFIHEHLEQNKRSVNEYRRVLAELEGQQKEAKIALNDNKNITLVAKDTEEAVRVNAPQIERRYQEEKEEYDKFLAQTIILADRDKPQAEDKKSKKSVKMRDFLEKHTFTRQKYEKELAQLKKSLYFNQMLPLAKRVVHTREYLELMRFTSDLKQIEVKSGSSKDPNDVMTRTRKTEIAEYLALLGEGEKKDNRIPIIAAAKKLKLICDEVDQFILKNFYEVGSNEHIAESWKLNHDKIMQAVLEKGYITKKGLEPPKVDISFREIKKPKKKPEVYSEDHFFKKDPEQQKQRQRVDVTFRPRKK